MMTSTTRRWGYRIEPTATGCRVTEWSEDLRPDSALEFSKETSGVDDRTERNRQTMSTHPRPPRRCARGLIAGRHPAAPQLSSTGLCEVQARRRPLPGERREGALAFMRQWPPLISKDGAIPSYWNKGAPLLVDLGGPSDAFFGVTRSVDNKYVYVAGYKGGANGANQDDAVVARIALS